MGATVAQMQVLAEQPWDELTVEQQQTLRSKFRVWAFKTMFSAMPSKPPEERFVFALVNTCDDVPVSDTTVRGWYRALMAMHRLKERYSRQGQRQELADELSTIVWRELKRRVQFRAWEVDAWLEASVLE